MGRIHSFRSLLVQADIIVPFAVYHLYGADERLLYVGCSGQPVERVRQHLREKPWAAEIARYTTTWYYYRSAALAAERLAIRTKAPQYNIIHNPRAHADHERRYRVQA